jgi:hypothetical protein
MVGAAHAVDAHQSDEQGHHEHDTNEDVETYFYGEIL